MTLPEHTRRTFVKRGAYVAPAIMTLLAAPAFAKSGSEKPDVDKPNKGNRGSDRRKRGSR
jgi:hypothetical protein